VNCCSSSHLENLSTMVTFYEFKVTSFGVECIVTRVVVQTREGVFVVSMFTRLDC